MTEHEYADEPLTEHEVLENLRPQGNVHVLTPEESDHITIPEDGEYEVRVGGYAGDDG